MPDGKKGETEQDECVGRDIERVAGTPPQPSAGDEKYGHAEKPEDELVIFPRRQNRDREQEKENGGLEAAFPLRSVPRDQLVDDVVEVVP